MTLLEVILAIAVAGFLLAAATSFVVSISNIWMERQDRNFFEDHVDGVTEFIRAAFANSGVEVALEDGNGDSSRDAGGQTRPDGEAPASAEPRMPAVSIRDGNPNRSNNQARTRAGGLVRSSEQPVGWARPPGFGDYQDPLLNFNLSEVPPLLVGLENAPVIGIDAFLHFDRNEGLSLLWYSVLQEEAESTNDLRRTELSSLVSKITYIYWDDRFRSWEETDTPQEGDGDQQYLLPRFVKLEFQYEGETRERVVTIPVPSKSALIF